MVDSGHKVVDCRPVASPMVVAHKLEVCKWVASHEEIGKVVVVVERCRTS